MKQLLTILLLSISFICYAQDRYLLASISDYDNGVLKGTSSISGEILFDTLGTKLQIPRGNGKNAVFLTTLVRFYGDIDVACFTAYFNDDANNICKALVVQNLKHKTFRIFKIASDVDMTSENIIIILYGAAHYPDKETLPFTEYKYSLVK